MDWVLIVAIAAPALLLVLGFVIGRLIRVADRADAARSIPAAQVRPAPATASPSPGAGPAEERIPLGRS